jgi:biopolymer transport protein ExbD
MNEKEFDSINVVPLVDVMLVLLTIVLMTSTFIATGSLPVQLPKASPSVTETLKSLVIEIDAQGRIFLNALPTSLPSLRNHLNSKNRQTPIVIRADKRIDLQKFVDVLDTMQILGFKKISLQTEESRS